MAASGTSEAITTPTYVLIHGGGTTARFWDLLVPHLPSSFAVTVPGRDDRPLDLNELTVDRAVDSIADDIEREVAGEVVLVAHSSGGLFVPGVVSRIGKERVKAIVLNAASVPPEGGAGLDCMKERHREMTLAGIEMAKTTPLPYDKPFASREALRTSSGEELDEAQTDFLEARNVAESINVYAQPVRWSETVGIPVTYIVNVRDRAVSPDLQRSMIDRLPVPPTVIESDTGHLPAVTAPVALAAMLLGVARLP